MFIVVGLGNIGREYVGTRHNIGFDVITNISDRYGIRLSKREFKSSCGQGLIDGEKVLLMKPETYMNLSGEAVVRAVDFYKIDPKSELIIIQDDIDLEVGNIRIRKRGSSGGHNGIKNIISHIGDEFIRVKVGVGKKPEGLLLSDYVLSHFGDDDNRLIRKVIEIAAESIVHIINFGEDSSMNKYNGLRVEE